jgi:hypothetical protein
MLIPGSRLGRDGVAMSQMAAASRAGSAGRTSSRLRAQPGHFRALTELNEAFPNHLGLYLDVTKPGVVRIGDTVEVIHP